MTRRLMIGVVIGLMSVVAAWGQVIPHSEFQAVDASGEHTYAGVEQVTLEGIVLNQPADMLDPTADDSVTAMYNLSGQWQFFFQGEGDDTAGTAVWMGQLYNNLPWVALDGGYTNAEWVAELTRLNAAQFAPGDRVRVTGYFLSYQGKMNVNEQHSNDPANDFTIELVEAGVGIPQPEVVTLDDLKDENDAFIFDPTRQAGGERYQSRLIKIADVTMVDPNGWGPYGELTVTDGVKTLPVKLGRGNGIYAGSCNLTEPFDIIGILDQEGTDLTGGYRLYVMNYDGNGYVLAAPEHRAADEAAMADEVDEPVEEEI